MTSSGMRALKALADVPRMLAVTIVATVTLLGTTATPASAAPDVLVGVTGGTSMSGARIALASHMYGKLEGAVPRGQMITFKSDATWGSLAAARSGSSIHKNLVRWADTLKGRGNVQVAFHHEPEAGTSRRFGSPEDYKRAYRKVVEVFRSRGANNVQFTWQMTAYAFSAPAGDRRAASKWYPGDGYVRFVAADPYNWFDCGSGRGDWRSMKSLLDPALRYARSHGKGLIVAEFASQRGTKRAAWLREATAYFAANRSTIHSVYYFPKYDPHHPDCKWALPVGSADMLAFQQMVRSV